MIKISFNLHLGNAGFALEFQEPQQAKSGDDDLDETERRLGYVLKSTVIEKIQDMADKLGMKHATADHGVSAQFVKDVIKGLTKTHDNKEQTKDKESGGEDPSATEKNRLSGL